MHATSLLADKDHRSHALASVAEPPVSQSSSRFHPGDSCGPVAGRGLHVAASHCHLVCLVGIRFAVSGRSWDLPLGHRCRCHCRCCRRRRHRQLPLLTTLLSRPPSRHRLPQTTSPPPVDRPPDNPSSSSPTVCLDLAGAAASTAILPPPLPLHRIRIPPVPSPLNDGKHPPATIDIAPLSDDASTALHPVRRRRRRRHLHRITSRIRLPTGAFTDLPRYL